jgi:hypothetical protein
MNALGHGAFIRGVLFPEPGLRYKGNLLDADVAQLVEQRFRKP